VKNKPSTQMILPLDYKLKFKINVKDQICNLTLI
jgi:hypothetical protein